MLTGSKRLNKPPETSKNKNSVYFQYGHNLSMVTPKKQNQDFIKVNNFQSTSDIDVNDVKLVNPKITKRYLVESDFLLSHIFNLAP